MEAKSIKNILEVLEAVKLLVVDGKKVMADGKISLADLGVAMDLLRQLPAMNAAIQDIAEVVPEAKDLSAEEIDQLIAKILEVVAAVKAA